MWLPDTVWYLGVASLCAGAFIGVLIGLILGKISGYTVGYWDGFENGQVDGWLREPHDPPSCMGEDDEPRVGSLHAHDCEDGLHIESVEDVDANHVETTHSLPDGTKVRTRVRKRPTFGD